MLSQTRIHPAVSRQTVARNGRTVPPVAGHPLESAIEMMGAPMSFGRNEEIFGENEPAEYLYKLMSGTVRTYKVLNDGRRQIGAFYLPGDIFGLDVGDEHTYSAEAVADSKVLVIKRSAVERLANNDREIAHGMWALTGRELQRVQDHVLVLIKTAQERVASFLLEMAARSRTGNEIELPMSRQDIADYLGLTIETVSRTFTQLENSAAIAVPSSRRIVLRNRAVLSRLNA